MEWYNFGKNNYGIPENSEVGQVNAKLLATAKTQSIKISLSILRILCGCRRWVLENGETTVSKIHN